MSKSSDDSIRMSIRKNYSESNLTQGHGSNKSAPKMQRDTPLFGKSQFLHKALTPENDMMMDDSISDSSAMSNLSFYQEPERRYGFNNRMLSEDFVGNQMSPLNPKSERQFRFSGSGIEEVKSNPSRDDDFFD